MVTLPSKKLQLAYSLESLVGSPRCRVSDIFVIMMSQWYTNSEIYVGQVFNDVPIHAIKERIDGNIDTNCPNVHKFER